MAQQDMDIGLRLTEDNKIETPRDKKNKTVRYYGTRGRPSVLTALVSIMAVVLCVIFTHYVGV